jgi:hypothetical protein
MTLDAPKRGPKPPELHQLVRARLEAGTLFRELPADQAVSAEPFGDAVLRRTSEILNPRHRHDAARARREARMAEVEAAPAGSRLSPEKREAAKEALRAMPGSKAQKREAFLASLSVDAEAARAQWIYSGSMEDRAAYLATLSPAAKLAHAIWMAAPDSKPLEEVEVIDYPEDTDEYDAWGDDDVSDLIPDDDAA